MTRFRISIGILAVLISISTFSGIWVNRRCDEMEERISEISQSISIGETENASENIYILESEWKKFRRTASVVVPNNKLSEIDCIISHLPFLIYGENSSIYAELNELKHLMILLQKGETPLLTSIF